MINILFDHYCAIISSLVMDWPSRYNVSLTTAVAHALVRGRSIRRDPSAVICHWTTGYFNQNG